MLQFHISFNVTLQLSGGLGLNVGKLSPEKSLDFVIWERQPARTLPLTLSVYLFPLSIARNPPTIQCIAIPHSVA